MRNKPIILQVAIHTPVRKLFDYLPPEQIEKNCLTPGIRLRVPFGKSSERIGLLVTVTDQTSIERHRLKRVIAIIDKDPVLSQKQLDLMLWAASYYHYPVGEVILGNIPRRLARGKSINISGQRCWKISDQTTDIADTLPARAFRQRSILAQIKKFPGGISLESLRTGDSGTLQVLNILEGKGLIESFFKHENETVLSQPLNKIDLNKQQTHAVGEIFSLTDSYHAILLDGITGSGKTEVYIHTIRKIVGAGKQALVLVPEIGLTPQFIQRFQEQIGNEISVMHSGLSDTERLQTWINARDNRTGVIVGTRSAVWLPLANPGIIIVDEEHDSSYKQQDGFRYSARDLAVIRAKRDNIPIVLGSATPSMESLLNVNQKRYREIRLSQRAGNARLPEIHTLDIRSKHMDGALSGAMLDAIDKQLKQREQTLLFLNRRGYAPVTMCHECGWISQCPRCEIHMTFHKSINKLHCHHCGHQEKHVPVCGHCHSNNILQIGHGTQRLLETLEKNFPGTRIARLDRDSTRRKGSMQSLLEQVKQGKIDILVGTQMTAKGHHFPGVTLAGLIDTDRGLFSSDFRGIERMAQLITQVSGRAGREKRQGTVLIQTHYPDHPLLKALSRHDYSAIAELILSDRKAAELPPYSFQALLRAEAHEKVMVDKFMLEAAKILAHSSKQLEAFGPYPAPIELKAGRHRMQLLIQSRKRGVLHESLKMSIGLLESITIAKKVRWVLDIDPQDML